MPRQLAADWLTSYVKYVEPCVESPEQWVWWSSLTALAASLKRHVWINRGSYKIFPNIYTCLVGAPGLGKGQAIMPVLSLLREANTANIMTDNITMQYVLEALSNGFQTPVITPSNSPGASPAMPSIPSGVGGNIAFSKESACIVVADEFSIFIHDPNYDLPNLNKLWDGGEGAVSYGTRGKGMFEITNPCQTLLAGSAPEYLVRCVPQSAVGGGFTRRVNFVYSQTQGKRKPWPQLNAKVGNDIVEDLRHIAGLRGEFKFDPLARNLFEKIHTDSKPQEYDDEALSTYRTSMWAHSAKIAMNLSASRDDSLVIHKCDLELAKDRIDSIIVDIPRVFRATGDSDMAAAADKVLKFVEIKGFASFEDILHANYRHVSKQDLSVIIETLVAGKIIQESSQGGKQLFMVVPQQQQQRAQRVAQINP